MRLINADSVKRGIAELKQSPWFKHDIGYVERKEAVEVVEHLCIDKEPTIDAVEVVRCKDCRHDHSRDCMVRLCGLVSGEFFCSMGERREDVEVR